MGIVGQFATIALQSTLPMREATQLEQDKKKRSGLQSTLPMREATLREAQEEIAVNALQSTLPMREATWP